MPPEKITWIANEAIKTMRQWLASVGLQLADHKTEVVLVTSRKTKENITIRVGACEITSKRSLKYLGVQIEAKLQHFINLLQGFTSSCAGLPYGFV